MPTFVAIASMHVHPPLLQGQLPRRKCLCPVAQIKHSFCPRELDDGLQHLVCQPRLIGPVRPEDPAAKK